MGGVILSARRFDVFHAVAGHHMTSVDCSGHRSQSWIFIVAAFDRIRAAGSKMTAAGRVHGRWDIAPQHVAGSVRVGIRYRNGGDECTRIGVPGGAVERIRIRVFHDAAQVHDGDIIGDVFDHRQVVGDEEICQLHFILQVQEQVENLRLDRNVQGRHRLVADDQTRFKGHGAGNTDPLALTAAELVGESQQGPPGQPHPISSCRARRRRSAAWPLR